MGTRIHAENVTLDVPVYLQRERRGTGWKDLLMGAAFDPPRRKTTRLLEDLSFEVNEGDRLAILGRNGAGKSTLLRVLNRVYQPTSGKLHVSGSCQALLNIALGFNNEATVRENVFLRGVAMGLDSSFLSRHLQPVLEFAGLEEKSNHRLHTLSSGQRLRLGFAISTSVQHDIMLMDEWVGAGDAQFMERAKERMQSRVGGSKIVVLASHSVSLLKDICNKGIVLEEGRLVHAGSIRSALKAYHGLMDTVVEQRKALVQHDQPAMPVYGRAAALVERGDDFVVLEGWCVDGEGQPAVSMELEIGGESYRASSITRISRRDVMRQFGLAREDCGFRVRFDIAGGLVVEAVEDLQLLAGTRGDRADTPLPLSAAILEQLVPEESGEDKRGS